MRLYSRRVFRRWRHSAACALLALGLSAPVAAQVQIQTDRLYIGSGLAPTSDPFIVQSLPAVSAGSGTINTMAIDGNGVVRKDAATTLSTAGAYTWGQPGTFTGGLISPLKVTGTSSSAAALGVDNVRVWVDAGGYPRAAWEDSGFAQWFIQNVAGAQQSVRRTVAGVEESAAVSLNDYVTFDPKSKALLPKNPYDIDIGSPIDKFKSINAAELNIETIVSQFIMATIGGRIIVAPTAKLRGDITSTQTTITVDMNNFASGDTGHMEGYGRFEDMLIGSGPTLINRCPTSGSCATADTVTSWNQTGGGALTLDRDHQIQGDGSVVVVNTASFAYWADGTAWMSSATAYAIQIAVRRSDDAPVVPATGSAYDIVCSPSDIATSTTADDLGPSALGHWYRLHGVCTHSTSTSLVGLTNIPTGGVTLNLDQVQVELGSTVTPWSQFASSYTVTRNRDGSGGNAWVAGSAVVNTGHAGSGMIDLYSTNGAYSGTEIGPTICGDVRLSTTYNDIAPRWCIGQLQGKYGFGSSAFGVAAGDNSGAHFDVTDANGMRIWAGGSVKLQATPAGHLSIAEGAIAINNLGITVTNTTGTNDEAKAYTFAGAVTHTKRTGLYYSESGSVGTMSLYIDHGPMVIQAVDSKLHLEGTGAASQLDLDTNFGLTAAGNIVLVASGILTINGNTGATNSSGCPGGQHVNGWVLVRGFTISFTCS